MRIPFIVLLFLIATTVNAQSNYSKADLTNFVKIYFKEKAISPINDSIIRNLFLEHNVSKNDYKNYIRNNNYNPEIEKLKVALDAKEVDYYDKRSLKLTTLCINNNLTKSDYLVIKNKYQHNIYFQRELKIIVDLYIQKQHSND